MAIDGEPYFKEKLGGNAYVLIARDDIQNEAGDGKACHQARNPDQCTHVAAKQCGVDQKLRKIRLHQTRTGGDETNERYTGKPLPVGQDEAQRSLILIQPDPCSFNSHLFSTAKTTFGFW